MRSRLGGIDRATMVGLLSAVGVYLVYQNALPTLADIRTASPHNDDAERARKHAAWISAGLVGGVFLVSRDFNSFCISGATLVGLDYAHKHANAVNPTTGRADVDTAQKVAQIHPLPEYADEA